MVVERKDVTRKDAACHEYLLITPQTLINWLETKVRQEFGIPGDVILDLEWDFNSKGEAFLVVREAEL